VEKYQRFLTKKMFHLPSHTLVFYLETGQGPTFSHTLKIHFTSTIKVLNMKNNIWLKITVLRAEI
jgi:hypothetical protein